MKKRIVSLILALVMILSLVPTAAFAAGGDYEVEIVASQFNTVQYNGKDTMKLDFMLKTNNGEQVTGIQTALLYVDTSKYVILGMYDGVPYDYTTTVCPEGDTAGSATEVVYSNYKTGTPPNVKTITGKVAGKTIDGKALLSLEPDAITNGFSFDTSTSMMSVLLGLKEGVEWEDLTSESVRYATASEAKAFNANAAVTINPTSGAAYQYLSADGTADTLTVTPVFEYPFSEPDDGGEDPGTTTNPSDFEIYYTLDKTDDASTNTGFKAYGVGDTVKATVHLVNKGEATNLQAYDIYLSYHEDLKFSKLTDMGAAKPYKADGEDEDDLEDVAKAKDKVVHIQAVADDFDAVVFAKNATIELGTIEFTIDGNNAVYGEEMPITLTQTGSGEETTNIAVGGDTVDKDGNKTDSEGDKQSHYPKVTQTAIIEGEEFTFSGAEVNTTYTVTFDDNIDETVTGMPENNTGVKQHNVAMELPTLTCTSGNYEFLGWSTDSEATTATYSVGSQLPASVNPADGLTLYAVWDANTHTVTWKDFVGTNYDFTEVIHGQKPTSPGTPTYELVGYTTEFKGWATEPDQSTGKQVSELPAVTGPVTYYAAFTVTPIEYTVVFDGNDADGGTAVESITVKYDQEFTMPANTYTKTGYTSLDQWYSTANGMSGTPYYIGEGFKYSKLTTENNGTVTLYAVWNPNTYTITFDTAGGNSIDSISNLYGAVVNKPAEPTKEGYTFAGWDPELPETMPAENKTYTAQWTINQYTITFDSDGGSDVAPITQDYNTAVTAPANPTKEGYTFAGWSPAVPSTMPAENMTVKAQWSKTAYSISHDTQIEVSNQTNPDAGDSANMNDTINIVVTPVTGYDLVDNKVTITYVNEKGNTLVDDNGDPITETVNVTKKDNGTYTGSFTMPASHVKVTGEYEAVEYTITFKNEDGTEYETITQDYGSEVSAPTAPEKEGYTFAGWVNEDDEVVTFPTTMPAEDMTLTASWTINQYTITFDTVGGSTVAAITKDYGADVGTVANPTKTGYTFAGWDVEIPATMPAEDLTITAQWTINQYTITFDTDGGSKIDPITQDYNTAVTGPTTTPTKTGYTFAGWDKEIPDTMPAENVTITAQWTANTVNITLDAGEGKFTDVEGTPSTQTTDRTFGTAYGVLAEPERGGYEFAGWQDGTTDITAETVVNKEGPVTLTAKWTANEYTVTFDPANGEQTTTAKFYTDQGFTTPAAPTKADYTFDGWLVTQDDGNWPDSKYNANSSASGYYGNVTLTAQWTQATNYVVENYLYARSDYRMLRVSATGVEANEQYLFNSVPMYYTTDGNYLVNTNDTGVFYTLIKTDYVGTDNKLTEDGYKLLTKAPLEDASRATITYDGDINGDTFLNVADANIVYQMVKLESGNYYSEAQLTVEQRLAADMFKETYKDGEYRGSTLDVEEIVKLINTKTN